MTVGVFVIVAVSVTVGVLVTVGVSDGSGVFVIVLVGLGVCEAFGSIVEVASGVSEGVKVWLGV